MFIKYNVLPICPVLHQGKRWLVSALTPSQPDSVPISMLSPAVPSFLSRTEVSALLMLFVMLFAACCTDLWQS